MYIPKYRPTASVVSFIKNQIIPSPISEQMREIVLSQTIET